MVIDTKNAGPAWPRIFVFEMDYGFVVLGGVVACGVFVALSPEVSVCCAGACV